MALFSITGDRIKQITKIPHDNVNRPIINRIPKIELDAIIDELNRRVDEIVDSHDELITAGWIPGSNWTGMVWSPIYTASGNDFTRAGMVFGALVFEVIMNRSEDWSLGKYQVNGRDIGSTTYFRIFPNH
ncbi:MAG: hypothetical protein VB085_07875 [Peptococcaceae bacterium]|nr:hypothetical protein [Peptococcaceae bacterium]